MSDIRVMLMPILLVLLSPLGIDLLLPAINDMSTTFNVSPATAQWSISSFVLALGLMQLPLGSFSDRFGRRPLILFGLGLFTIASIYAYFTTSFTAFVIVRFLQGLGASACVVAAFTIAKDSFEEETVPSKFSYLHGILNLAPAIAPMIGAAIIIYWGWRSIFIVFAVSAIILAIFAFMFFKETADLSQSQSVGAANFFKNVKTIVKTPQSWPAAIICITVLSYIITYLTISPVILIQQAGLSISVFSQVFSLNAALIMVAALMVPRINQWLSVSTTIIIGLLFIIISSIALFFIGLENIDSAWKFMLPIGLGSIGFAISFGNAQGVAVNPFGGLAGMAIGVLGTIQMAIASIVATILVVLDSGSTLYYGGSFTLIMSAALLYWLKRSKA
jgi:DHA1 family bicyclomycin/chloramphenicol resistance-like MFS transporter